VCCKLQVVRHKHQERDGVTSLVLACGSKKPKQLHPRQLGEFQVGSCCQQCHLLPNSALPL
jgi:hypothetical protein